MSAFRRYAEHGELTVGVIGGFLLAALVLVLQNPTNFETFGKPYVDVLLFVMATGVFSSFFGTTVWSFIAATEPEENIAEMNNFALTMTSVTDAMLLFTIPLLILPFYWPLGIAVGAVGFGIFTFQSCLSYRAHQYSLAHPVVGHRRTEGGQSGESESENDINRKQS